MSVVVEFIRQNPAYVLVILDLVLVLLIGLVMKAVSSKKVRTELEEIQLKLIEGVKDMKFRTLQSDSEQKATEFTPYEKQYKLKDGAPYDLIQLPDDLDVQELIQSSVDECMQALLDKFAFDFSVPAAPEEGTLSGAPIDNELDDNLHKASIAVNALSDFQQKSRASLEEAQKANAAKIAELQKQLEAAQAALKEVKDEKTQA